MFSCCLSSSEDVAGISRIERRLIICFILGGVVVCIRYSRVDSGVVEIVDLVQTALFSGKHSNSCSFVVES